MKLLKAIDNQIYSATNKDILTSVIETCKQFHRYLYAELELSGEDELNNAVRVTIQQGKNVYTVKHGEPILMDAFQLTTKDRYLCFDFYYELEDPSCTIDNINNATGTDVTLKLYGYVTE